MLIPAPYEGQNWYPSFAQFMTAACPSWREHYKCIPAKPKRVRAAAGQFAPDIPRLPEEYLTFLAQIGGQGLDLNQRAWFYQIDRVYQSGDRETRLTIGSYSLLDEEDMLVYCFPKEGPPYPAWERVPREERIKVADSLGQLLCNQAFLAEGKEQFPVCCPMALAFPIHEPLYGPCPEAEEYCRTHSVEGLTEKELWDIGFQIQVKKLESSLKELGYKRAWFSTELDHIWLKEDACCILSRDFDPNDMFDTVVISLLGMDREAIWPLAEQFKTLGYGNYLELRDGFTWNIVPPGGGCES